MERVLYPRYMDLPVGAAGPRKLINATQMERQFQGCVLAYQSSYSSDHPGSGANRLPWTVARACSCCSCRVTPACRL